ncbi:MAG: hypothetical protein LUQ09_01040 [Methanomassiliicoccales archaeon]|nr:hypothetical protein [Methanomassiliicoccales archaeon]
MGDCRKCNTGLESIQMDEVPKLTVKGKDIGINELDSIMNDIRERNLPADAIGKALLDEVNRRDYVPPSMKEQYEIALLDEYRRRFG